MVRKAEKVIMFLAIGLLVIPCWAYAATAEPLAPGDPLVTANEKYREALARIRVGRNNDALPLLEAALAMMPANRHLQADYVLCLVWTGAYQQAVEYYEPREVSLRELRYVPRHVARAYYELREYSKALELYWLGWSYQGSDEEAFKGVIATYLRMDNGVGAYTSWEEARQGRLISAVTLETVRVQLLEHYGASLAALDVVTRTMAADQNPRKMDALKGNRAVALLRWGEVDQALVEFEAALAQDPSNLRARGDYIVALRQKDRMGEALSQFEIYTRSGAPVPYWVSEAVADAYLYLRMPEEAEAQYKITLQKDPANPLLPLLGLGSAYTELRDWDKASQTFAQADALLAQRKQALTWDDSVLAEKRYVADRNSVILAKGWLLLSQEKLQESQAYFDHFLQEAAADTSLRSGLGHAYLWRQWPRRAREQFEIATDLNPNDKKALTGLGWTLNTLNYKREARSLADSLQARYPTDLFVRDLQDSLRAEDAWHVQPEFRFIKEFEGSTEYWLSLLLEKPLSPTFCVLTQVLRQEAWDDTQVQTARAEWDRLGVGFRWILVPELLWRQTVSLDYIRGSDVGSFTQLLWWTTDPLKLTAEYDSFSMSVPIRARARGITAQQAALDVLNVESDLREYGVTGGTYWFSDTNVHPYAAARFAQTVLSQPNLKMLAGFELSYGGYTKQDVDYYSPAYEWAALLTSAVHWVTYQRYEKRWLSAAYLRAGVSGESGFGVHPVAGITLEQTVVGSKTFDVTGNVSYDLKVYDGDYTHVLGVYLSLNWRF